MIYSEKEKIMVRIAMEWGFKYHEKGNNIEKAREDFENLIR